MKDAMDISNLSIFEVFGNATINKTRQDEWILNILRKEMSKRHFDPVTEAILLACYSFFITFGALGNGLVIFVVLNNYNMRTPRNIFIFNLAVSDLTLCLFTQPLNVYLMLFMHWRLGEFMCKFVTVSQGTNIFVSTISITAIALDRFQVIVYPTKDSMKKLGAVIALISIWLISFLMASPALLFSVLHRRIFIEEEPNLFMYICMEDATMVKEKQAYSVAMLVVQYIVPFIIVSVAHLGICNKLRYRMVTEKPSSTGSSSFQRKHNERRSLRKRKTNFLLGAIALIFALSWMPLNLLNLLTDFNGEYVTSHVDVKLAYAICHMLVLCSACINPVLYGWLNDNFRTEFIQILYCPCCERMCDAIRHVCCCPRRTGSIPTITLTKVGNGQSLAIDEIPENVNDDVPTLPYRTHQSSYYD